MKQTIFLIQIVLLYACSPSELPNEASSINLEYTLDDTVIEETIPDSNAIKIEDQYTKSDDILVFNQFLGLKYGDKEHVIFNNLGKFTSGVYTEDSTAFIYHFNRIDRVPISIWVSTKTNKVITIFMEVISLDENFELDLTKAIDEFNISEKDASWFGLSAAQIKEELGKPSEESTSSNGTSLLSYDSIEYTCTVAFKIYPEQENKCTSISVNWFYK